MSLGDLDELVLSCRNDDGRKYIAEAVACYKAGAYRACIVSTWIAVVYDLLSKVRELSLSGDKEAQLIVDNLAKWQPQIEQGNMDAVKSSLGLERSIVTIVNEKFGFFEGMQVMDLERLHDDRNRCAHPTYQGTEQPYSPSAELARAHLVHAVQHVLSQVAVQGKAATAQIVRLVESAYFPSDVEQAKQQMKSSGLDRPRDSLVRSVADALVFGMLEGEAALMGRAQTATAIRAIFELSPGVAEPRIKRDLNVICRRLPDPSLPLIIALQRVFSSTWSLLEEDNRARLRELIQKCTDDLATRVIPIIIDIPEAQDACGSRVAKFDRQNLGELAKKTKHPIVLQAGVDLYCSSTNWDSANANYSSLVEPLLGELNEVQLRRILHAPVEEDADLRGSHGFNNFCRYVYENEKLPREEVVEWLKENNMKHLASKLEVNDEFPF